MTNGFIEKVAEQISDKHSRKLITTELESWSIHIHLSCGSYRTFYGNCKRITAILLCCRIFKLDALRNV